MGLHSEIRQSQKRLSAALYVALGEDDGWMNSVSSTPAGGAKRTHFILPIHIQQQQIRAQLDQCYVSEFGC